jgi:hypothetical protein
MTLLPIEMFRYRRTAYNSNYRFEKEKKDKECIWCKKKDFRYKGHVFTECNKLKAFNQKKKEDENEKSKKEEKKENVSRIEDVSDIDAFSAHSTSYPFIEYLIEEPSCATNHVE